MKKRLLLFTAIAIVGTATFTFSTLRAQTDTAPATPPVTATTPPNPVRPMGVHRNIRYALCHQALESLKRLNREMLRAKEDYDGHRQPTVDACEKAIQELEAIQPLLMAAPANPAQAPAAPAAPATPPQP